ncbi:alternate-type signal peptide domain-containing protein [Protaetiibacter mangrovi]|uniref:Alternate-type signal peptide domain-containing protein n=2 Tax=Microbacteriaceae TaxID=85023 RepID=A0ABT1ZIE8_9MICO|nr:alternate-type signal peptide domain-containing protein [Protaetiibacter mangrovi]MCS0500494.1 alternate-type signal peptide domain-containing protein [Protaetiibacter mangrovi]
MNKNIKASIAIAAGVILLMGGAGSLAYWNDSVNVGPASGSNSISAGTLSVAAVNAGTWTKAFYNASNTQVVAPATVSPLSGVSIVPGNRLVYTQTFNITATGQDLWFTIGTTNGAVSGTTASAADTALALAINNSTNSSISVGSVTGGNVVAATTPGVYKVNSSAGPSTITVTWTVDFPFGASASNTSKLGSVSLSQGAITLTQVAAP